MARALPFPLSAAMRLLAVPALTDAVLGAIGHKGRFLDPLLHDTVSATVVRGGEALNVIPAEVKLVLDGRLVPGGKPDELLAEVRALLGPDAEVRVVEYEPGPAEADLSLFDTLAGVLREVDPDGIPVPFVLAGVTDARIFSTLGIQTYGFTPLKLPPDLVFDPAPARRGRARARRGARVRDRHHPPAVAAELKGFAVKPAPAYWIRSAVCALEPSLSDSRCLTPSSQ